MTTTTRRQLAERLYGPGVGCGAAECVFGRAAVVTSNGRCACRRQYLTASRLARMVDAALAGGQETPRQPAGVTIDAKRQGGAPCVAGTRIPVRDVYAAATLEGRQAAHDQYGLTAEQVDAAVRYWETDPYALVLRDIDSLGERLEALEERLQSGARQSQAVQPEASSDWPALPEGYEWGCGGLAVTRGTEIAGSMFRSARGPVRLVWHGQCAVLGEEFDERKARLRLAWHAWDEAA